MREPEIKVGRVVVQLINYKMDYSIHYVKKQKKEQN